MRRRDWITMFVWAGGTFAVALAAALPVSLNATDGIAPLKPQIAQAAIINNGVELSVVEDNSVCL